MKTAISLPDELFERAERVAKALNVNRSQLYTRALREFLEQHDPEAITAAFDAVYENEATTLDTELLQMQLLSLENEAW